MTRPRARTLHKSGQNGKSGSGDTIGIRVPSEDALRKIAFNVASASGGRGKKNARATKIRRGCPTEGDESTKWMRGRRRREAKKRTMMRNRDSGRGNVATLLIENSSALAILIKSRKSLARSIGQTGKDRSVGSRALWQRSRSQCLHFTLFPPFALWALFRLFEILEPIVAEETQIVILYKWGRNIYLSLMRRVFRFKFKAR